MDGSHAFASGYGECRACGLEPPSPAGLGPSIPPCENGPRLEVGPWLVGRGNESDLRGTLPTIPSAWLLVVSGTAGTGYRCRLRVGMPQPLCVAPRQLKKTHLASTALKSGSHGWTASCRDNERTCTKYFPTKASGDWDLAQLKCGENKNRWHVMPDFDPYWEDMDTLRRNL